MGISHWVTTSVRAFLLLFVGAYSATSSAGIYLYDKYGQFYRVEGQTLSGPYPVPKSPREGEVLIPGSQPFLFKGTQEKNAESPASYTRSPIPFRTRVDTDLSEAIFEAVIDHQLTEGRRWKVQLPGEDRYRLEQMIPSSNFISYVTRDEMGSVALFIQHPAYGAGVMKVLYVGEDNDIARVQSAPLGNGLIISFWKGFLAHLTMDAEGKARLEYFGPAGGVIDAHVGIISDATATSGAVFGLVTQILNDEGNYEFFIHDSRDLNIMYPLDSYIVDQSLDPVVNREVDPMGMVSNDQVYNPDALRRASEGDGATENLIDWEGRRVYNPPRAKFRKVEQFLDFGQDFKCEEIATGKFSWLPPSN